MKNRAGVELELELRDDGNIWQCSSFGEFIHGPVDEAVAYALDVLRAAGAEVKTGHIRQTSGDVYEYTTKHDRSPQHHDLGPPSTPMQEAHRPGKHWRRVALR